MEAKIYLSLKKSLIDSGYSEEIEWQTNIKPVKDPIMFKSEAIWVILNSGMKEQIARMIWNKIQGAWKQGVDISNVFGHKGKVSAIKVICHNYQTMFSDYLNSEDKISYLKTIPFIGEITCFHLAKNLGHDVIKPDRHLVRIANEYDTDCNTMCNKLSSETGDKVSVVDIVLWRSANLGWI